MTRTDYTLTQISLFKWTMKAR